jgi:dipeptidyl-peptidase 4
MSGNDGGSDPQATAVAQFPARKARTGRFTCGAPRAARVIGDGSRALFLRSEGPEDLVGALWMSVIEAEGSHREVLLADPRELLADADNEDVPDEEKARRERAREGGHGIVSYSVDAAGRRVVFTINGQLFVSEIDVDGARTRQVVIGVDDGREDDGGATEADGSSSDSKWMPVLNPRISPDGRHIAYTTGTRLVMVDLAEWGDEGLDGEASDDSARSGHRGQADARAHTCAAEAEEDYRAANVNDTNAFGDRFSTVWSVGADPDGTLKIGLAEFVAGEEMDRYDGFWWAPDSHGLLFEMYDSSPEPVWYISDPTHPDKPAVGRHYARALTRNAVVRLMLAHLEFDASADGLGWASGDDENAYDGAHDADASDFGDEVGVFETLTDGGSSIGSAYYVGCDVQNVSWNRETYEYVAAVHWNSGHNPLVLVQNRRQTRDQVLEVQPDGRTKSLEEHANDQWIDIVPGVPSFTPDGRLVCALNDMQTDTNRLTVDGKPFTPAGWQVRTVLDVRDDDILAVVQRTPSEEDVALPRIPAAWQGDEALHDARSFDVVAIDFDGNIMPVTAGPGVWSASRAGDGIVVSGSDMRRVGSVMVHAATAGCCSSQANEDDKTVCRADGQTDDCVCGKAYGRVDDRIDECVDGQANGCVQGCNDDVLARDTIYAAQARIASHAATPGFTPNTAFVRLGEHRLFAAITRPSVSSRFAGASKLPVLLKPYGGPGFQMVAFSHNSYAESQWWADQGFIVVTADGRGTTGRGPKWDREIFERMKDVTLADQVEAVRALPQVAPDADLERVAMIGWSYGGYLSALAVLDAPDVVHAACAGAPPTDWALYDTHYTERYLGLDPAVYERNSIITDAPKLERPLMLIHGFADDNVSIANSLRLSQALMEAGRPHTYLPLTGITHMTNDPKVAENLLVLQRDFLYEALGLER